MKIKIEYQKIDKLKETVSDSTYSYTLPPVTREDKDWAKRMKKCSTAQLKEELKTQIQNCNARRVHWLLSIERVRVRGRYEYSRELALGDTEAHAKYILDSYAPPLSQERFDFLKGILLKFGPKPEHAYGSRGGSVLASAALNNHIDVLGLYFDSGEKHAKSYILSSAIQGKHKEAFDYIVKHTFPQDAVNAIKQAYQYRNSHALERLLQLDDKYYEDESLSNASNFTPLFDMCGPGTLKQFDHFLDITLRSGKYTIERILEYAITLDSKDAIRYLENVHNADIRDLAEDRVDKAIKTCNDRMLKYLNRKGVNVDKALEYYRENKASSSSFVKELSNLFSDMARKKALVTWDVEDENTIRRTRTTDKIKTEWIFYFEEQTILQATYAVSEENEKTSDQLWQMADFKNQSLIAEAATVLSDKGGEPGDIFGKTAQPITGVDKPKFPNIQAVKP